MGRAEVLEELPPEIAKEQSGLLPDLPTDDILEADSHGIVWDEPFIALPTSIMMLEEDLGLPIGGCQDIAKRVELGDERAKAQSDQIREVYIEAMRRRRVKRPKCNMHGQPLFRTKEGKDTTLPYEVDSHGAVTGNNSAVKQWRSAFGVLEHEARTAPGTPMVLPGHWMHYVREHWLDLMPKLRFQQKKLRLPPAHYRTQAEIDAAKDAHARNVMDDESPARRELLAWLVPFLKNKMRSSWDGRC